MTALAPPAADKDPRSRAGSRNGRSVRIQSAASYLGANVVTAAPDDTVATASNRVRATRGPLDAERIYVIDDQRRLAGTVPVSELLRLNGEQRLREVMAPFSSPTVTSQSRQGHAANVALRQGLTEVPIADENGSFLGVVPTTALLQILRHEHVESLHRMAGISRQSAHARRAMEASPTRRTRDRLPWLLVGLAGSMLATFVVGRFERTLETQVAIAFFMPGLVYLADAIGTQSEAIMVRGLSTTHAGAGKILWGELRTGFLLGVILGALAFGGALIAFRNTHLALAIGLTIVISGTLACSVGSGLPWLFQRLDLDPAFGSGPLATIIQDVFTLLVYFAAVILLL
jgi:magnesium transporter